MKKGFHAISHSFAMWLAAVIAISIILCGHTAAVNAQDSPACMDKRTVWDTGLVDTNYSYKLYLYLPDNNGNGTCDDYVVKISYPGHNNETASVITSDTNPFILLPLEPYTEIAFAINFYAPDNITLVSSEGKRITYQKLCEPWEADSPWQVKLAPPEKIDSELRTAGRTRSGNTLLFDFGTDPDLAGKIARAKNSKFQRYYRFYLADTISSNPPQYRIKKFSDFVTLIDNIVDAPVNSGGWQTILPYHPDRPMPQRYDVVRVVDPSDNSSTLGWRAIKDVTLVTAASSLPAGYHVPCYMVSFFCDNYTPGNAFYILDYGYMDMSKSDAELKLGPGTKFEIYSLNDECTSSYIALAAAAWRLGLRPSDLNINGDRYYPPDGYEDSPITFYRIVRDFLDYDPMLGGANAYFSHGWASYGICYDLIKDDLTDPGFQDPDYTYEERLAMNNRIREKIARLADYLTVRARTISAWKYSSEGSNFTTYLYSSMGTVVHAMADYEPPKGSLLTGPREWMDNAFQLMHRNLEREWLTKDGIENTSNMYCSAGMQDVASFAWIHYRMTGIKLIKENRFEEALLSMIRTVYGDTAYPYWGAGGGLGSFPATIYQNTAIFGKEISRMMQWVIDKLGESQWDYRAGNFDAVQELFLRESGLEPLSPEDIPLDDTLSAMRAPTQFLTHANQAVFRDSWEAGSRQLFIMGKGEGIGNDWLSNFDLGHIEFYEKGEHLITPDPNYWKAKSRYQNSTVLVDGLFTMSQKPGNGELTHYFRHPAEEDAQPFIESAQIDSFFLADGETKESLFTKDFTCTPDSVYGATAKYVRNYVIPDWFDYPCDFFGGYDSHINTPQNCQNIADYLIFTYPDDVAMSRQVLYLKDYALLFDEMSGNQPHTYEISLQSPRQLKYIKRYDSNREAVWEGVEAKNSHLKRNPYSSSGYYTDYKHPTAAGRTVHIVSLTDDPWNTAEYQPESLNQTAVPGINGDEYNFTPMHPFYLGYVSQVKTGAAGAQFLNVIYSENKQVAGDEDELTITRLSGIENGFGAKIKPAVNPSYEDTVILRENAVDTSYVDNLDFTGKLMIARKQGSAISGFYLKESSSLKCAGSKLYEAGSGTVHHISLAYSADSIKGYVEGEGETSISIHSGFRPEHVKMNLKDIGWEDLNYSLNPSQELIIIDLPLPTGAVREGELYIALTEIPITNNNAPPVLASIGNKTIAEISLLTFTVSASDPDADQLTYSTSNLPTGAAFNPATRAFTWTPNYVQAGIYPVTFAVADNKGGADQESITITVTNTNRPPIVIPVLPKTVDEGRLITFTIVTIDPDGDPMTYSAANLPAGAAFNPATHAFTWTPNYEQAGAYQHIRFEVRDNNGGVVSTETAITVNNVNRPPVLDAIGDRMVSTEFMLAFRVSAVDPDGDQLAYSAANLPAGALFDSSTRMFTWTPAYNQTGTYSVTFAVADGKDGSDEEDITITVTKINRPPIILPRAGMTVNEGSLITFTVVGIDPDNDSLTYSASNLPAGASFDPTTHTFTWIPTFLQAGTYKNIRFEVRDNNGGFVSTETTITVSNVNRPPVIFSIPAKAVNEGSLLTFTIVAIDPDGDPMTYSAYNLPAGASFNPTTRVFTWTPAYNQAGVYQHVRFEARDNNGGFVSAETTITVNNVM